jgi:hypothetical protein
MVRNIVEDASQCCGMQLRTTPADGECKEKVHRKRESKEIRNRDYIEAP